MALGIGFRLVFRDRIWLWVYYNKIPIYPKFYLLKGDYPYKGLPTGHLCGDLIRYLPPGSLQVGRGRGFEGILATLLEP